MAEKEEAQEAQSSSEPALTEEEREAQKQARIDDQQEFTANISRRRGGRKKSPSILQMEATECGAACLAMVMAYHDCWLPLEQVRLDCGVSRDGSKALNIIYAARDYGARARGYRCQPETLYDLPFPMILFWDFNHFVVLDGIKKDKYYLNDPATGPRVVDEREFNRSFTGIVLAIEPTEKLRKRSFRKPSFARDLHKFLSGQYSLVAFLFIAGVILIVPSIVFPVFSKIFIDDILVRGTKDWMRVLILGMVAGTLFTALLTWIQIRALNRFQQKLSILFSSRFFWHLMRLPMTFYAQRHVGDINARVQASDRIAGLISGELAVSAVQMVLVVTYGAVMMFYSVWMTLGVLLLNLISLGALKLSEKIRMHSLQRLEKEGRKLAGVSISGVSIIETLKGNGLENEFFSKWAGYHGNMVVAMQRYGAVNNILSLFPDIIGSLQTIMILAAGSYLIGDGLLTVGGVIAFNMLAGNFAAPFASIMELSQNLQIAKVDIAQVNDVFKYARDERYTDEESPDSEKREDASVAPSPGRMIGRLSGRIEIRDLTFGYNLKGDPLLRGISVTIEPGQRVAFVGSSGSGKSTVARLIVGLLKPWSGEILYDGKPAEAYGRAITHSLAFVDQDIVLFKGTLRQNISLWDNSMSEQKITSALRDADILADIGVRPNRYDTEIDENGRNFSGGQRQRLEIARALSTDPSIIVFDEATAALDPVTEKRIDENIRRRGCTSIIVAHRLSTIRDADEIIVLDQGLVVERGSHEELVANKDSYYYKLVSAA